MSHPIAFDTVYFHEVADELESATEKFGPLEGNCTGPGYHGVLKAEASTVSRRFRLGDRVTKTKGSSWTGHVVGFYSTELTPNGYAIESENEPGSVQIYPESALKEHGG